MGNPICIGDIRLDDLQRLSLTFEGFGLAHWQTLPRYWKLRLKKLQKLMDKAHYEAETIALVWGREGVEGIQGVERWEDLDDDGNEGADWQT